MHRLLFEGKINVTRRAYIWNLVSNTAFSIQSALYLWIITKIAGASEAGSFVILNTVAQTLYSVGHYNIRDFQVSDVRREYSLSCYYTARWITSGAMVLMALAYSLFKGLSTVRCVVLLCLVGYRFVECFEDVFHGYVQREGRFDVTCICASIRIMLSSLAFCVFFLITGNQMSASTAMLIVSLLVFFLLLRTVRVDFPELRPAISFNAVLRLLRSCFPVFIGAFLYVYLINAPKYAIDDFLSAEVQTIYNILSMPAFVINTFSVFVYKPQIVRMSQLWDDQKTVDFGRQVLKQALIIALLTVVVAAGGGLIGLKLLEMIYNVPLMEYRSIFMLLLCIGGITAMAFYFSVLITMVRKQQFILIGYLAALAVSLLFTGRLVSRFQIRGACFAYGLIAVFLMLFFLAVIITAYVKAKREVQKT